MCFDPLDGSSNIDCLVSIGTIFAIYKKVDFWFLSSTMAGTPIPERVRKSMLLPKPVYVSEVFIKKGKDYKIDRPFTL